MKSFKQFHEAAFAAPLVGAGAKTLLKVGGAVLAAKGGEKILKKLLGTKKKPVRTDWDTSPKDDIDRELNVKQGQAKDAEKYKDFDKKVRTAKKAVSYTHLRAHETLRYRGGRREG